jgi:hypothetical protein
MSLGQPEAKQGYLRSTSAAMPSPLLVGSASRYWFASRGTPACTTKASTQLLTWVSEHRQAVRTKRPGGDRSGRVHYLAQSGCDSFHKPALVEAIAAVALAQALLADMTLARQGMVAPDRALRPRQHNYHSGDMPDRPSALDALIRDAEAAAAEQTDPLAVLVMLMRLVIRSDADPYLLNGALIEGIAMTIIQRIPAERREEVSRQVMRVLHDRLRAKGAI